MKYFLVTSTLNITIFNCKKTCARQKEIHLDKTFAVSTELNLWRAIEAMSVPLVSMFCVKVMKRG